MELQEQINRTHNIVLNLLQNFHALRDNDDLLYAEILDTMQVGRFSASTVLRQRARYGIPPYETVRRSRAKIQEKYPELRGKNYGKRRKAEDAYIEYARS